MSYWGVILGVSYRDAELDTFNIPNCYGYIYRFNDVLYGRELPINTLTTLWTNYRLSSLNGVYTSNTLGAWASRVIRGYLSGTLKIFLAASTIGKSYRIGYPMVFKIDNSFSYEDNANVGEIYPNPDKQYIEIGKYRLVASNNMGLSMCSFEFPVSVNGVYYDNLAFNREQPYYAEYEGSDGRILNALFGISQSNVSFYHSKDKSPAIAVFKSTDITEDNRCEIQQIVKNDGTIIDEYKQSIWEIGTRIEVPEHVYDWFNASFEKLYDYNYEVKNSKGQVLASLEYAPEMKKATLSRVGNHNILTMLGINDINYTIEWDSSSRLENAIYLGLNTFNLASYATIPVGETIDVNINKSTTFYDVFATIDEPSDAFDIVFYKNMAEQNKLDKRDLIQSVLNLRGVFRNESSIVNPTFVIQSDVFDFNYCYISKFNRYYFIDNITSVGYNLWRISLTVDVLMSYREQINMLEAVVKRNEFDFDAHLVDVNVPTTIQPIIEYEEIPSDTFDTTEDNEYYICLGVSW